MKFISVQNLTAAESVTLRVRVWIEIIVRTYCGGSMCVTLRVRVWIEMTAHGDTGPNAVVTLRVMVWFEMSWSFLIISNSTSHPPCEGVD